MEFVYNLFILVPMVLKNYVPRFLMITSKSILTFHSLLISYRVKIVTLLPFPKIVHVIYRPPYTMSRTNMLYYIDTYLVRLCVMWNFFSFTVRTVPVGSQIVLPHDVVPSSRKPRVPPSYGIFHI